MHNSLLLITLFKALINPSFLKNGELQTIFSLCLFFSILLQGAAEPMTKQAKYANHGNLLEKEFLLGHKSWLFNEYICSSTLLSEGTWCGVCFWTE